VIKLRRIREEGHVARMKKRKNAYGIVVNKPEEKRPLGRPRLKWEDNINMEFQEMRLGYGLDLSGSGQGQVVGSYK
jgi:hypothetical protein